MGLDKDLLMILVQSVRDLERRVAELEGEDPDMDLIGFDFDFPEDDFDSDDSEYKRV